MTKFGESDDIYSLLNEYQIQPWESWTIEQKVIHAPGYSIIYTVMYSHTVRAFSLCMDQPMITNIRTKAMLKYYYIYMRLFQTGPWLTFEIQLPQDDFHLLAWVLGEKLPEETIKHTRDTYNLRGLDSERALLQGKQTNKLTSKQTNNKQTSNSPPTNPM